MALLRAADDAMGGRARRGRFAGQRKFLASSGSLLEFMFARYEISCRRITPLITPSHAGIGMPGRSDAYYRLILLAYGMHAARISQQRPRAAFKFQTRITRTPLVAYQGRVALAASTDMILQASGHAKSRRCSG